MSTVLDSYDLRSRLPLAELIICERLQSIRALRNTLTGRRITTGAVRSTPEQKRILAERSHAFNLTSKKFRVSLAYRPTILLTSPCRKCSLTYVQQSIVCNADIIVRHARDERCSRHGCPSRSDGTQQPSSSRKPQQSIASSSDVKPGPR